jgi:hypothetical protein
MTGGDPISRTQKRPGNVTLTTDLEYFVASHSAHGLLRGDIEHLAVTGYRHAITCSCGATFYRRTIPRGAGAREGRLRPGEASACASSPSSDVQAAERAISMKESLCWWFVERYFTTLADQRCRAVAHRQAETARRRHP